MTSRYVVAAICGGEMKHWIYTALLCLMCGVLHAQEWTPQDSLRLQRLLQQEGEIKLNLEPLLEKQWMEFDNTLPTLPEMPKEQKKVKLTLRPYSTNTPYNWDPVYQRKITVKEDTWRSDPFYHLKKRTGLPIQTANASKGMDLMAPFTREFWNWKRKRLHKRTLQLLRSYHNHISPSSYPDSLQSESSGRSPRH